MGAIGIIGAMGLEINLLKDSLKKSKTYEFAGIKYYEGIIGSHNVVLTTCGIGKVNAAIYTQILLSKFSIDLVINTGIAGGIASNVQRGDIVIASNVTYHDVRPTQMKNCFPFLESFEADSNLIKFAEGACEGSYTYHIGRIITGDSFVADDDHKQVLRSDYDPLCVEMEGAAIAHTCAVNKVPFVFIRCISDNADSKAPIDYQMFEQVAADKAARIVSKMLKAFEK